MQHGSGAPRGARRRGRGHHRRRGARHHGGHRRRRRRAAKRAGKRAGSARGEDKAGAGKRLDVKAAQAAGRVGAGGVGGGRREKTNAGGGKRAKGAKMLAEKIVLSAGHAAGHARHAAATFPGDVARQLRLAQQQLAQSHAPFAMHGPGHVDAGRAHGVAAQGYPGHIAAGMGMGVGMAPAAAVGAAHPPPPNKQHRSGLL